MNDRNMNVVVLGIFTVWGFIVGVGATLIFKGLVQ